MKKKNQIKVKAPISSGIEYKIIMHNARNMRDFAKPR